MRTTNRQGLTRMFTDTLIRLALIGVIWTAPGRAAVSTSQDTPDALRLSLAMDFGNPNAHLVLAKSIRSSGDLLTAFLICENARKLFGDEAFLSSFDIVFRGHVPDVLFHARKQILREAIDLAPQSAGPLKALADLYAAHGEPENAAEVLKRAMELSPQDVTIVESLHTNLQNAGKSSDAQAFLNDWCQAHPDTPLACERRVEDQLIQNGDAAAALLDEALKKYPSDGQLVFMRAQLEEVQKPDQAQADHIAAARLATDSAEAQAAAARFFTKIRPDPKRAVDYYLAAYFIDPDFNDWESVGERIREGVGDIVSAKLAALRSPSTAPANLLTDPNPMVTMAAISEASEHWDGSFTDPLLALTTFDAPDLREAAIKLLTAHPTSPLDQRLAEMEHSENPWHRAAAASIIVTTQPASTKQLAALLGDTAILVRFETAMTLIERTDASRQIVIDAMRNEPSEWLRNQIAARLIPAPASRGVEILSGGRPR